MSEKKGVPKIKWKLIKVPEEVWAELKRITARRKIAIWKLLEETLSYWRTQQLEHHATPGLTLDKVSWYAFKISSSVGELKANPTKDNLFLLEKTCNQISERLGIKTDEVLLSASQYIKKPTPRNRAVLNQATKHVIAQIISKWGGRE